MGLEDRSKKTHYENNIDLSINKKEYVEDPLSELYQLDQDETNIDKEDLIMITKIFDDIEDFHKFRNNIKNLISNDSMIEDKIINFFKNLVENISGDKHISGQNRIDTDHVTRKNILFRLIFELPELIRERIN